MKKYIKPINFRVLIGTPHADVKNYCLANYIKTVKGLSHKNYDVLVVDNSETNDNQKRIRKEGIAALWVKRKNKSTREVMCESQECLRTAALDGGYDFLLHFESDITPPFNVIERLLSHQKTVVSASYFIGEGANSHLMVQEIEKHEHGVRNTINLTNRTDMKYADGKLHEVYACGLGMTLIHKSVLKQFKFRFDKNIDAHSDTFFAHDLQLLGIKQYLDSSILCKHDNRSWDLIKNK